MTPETFEILLKWEASHIIKSSLRRKMTSIIFSVVSK